jgi:hypothetical protein
VKEGDADVPEGWEGCEQVWGCSMVPSEKCVGILDQPKEGTLRVCEFSGVEGWSVGPVLTRAGSAGHYSVTLLLRQQ